MPKVIGKKPMAKHINLQQKKKNKEKSSYQEYCTFNKVYLKTLDYTLTIPKTYWQPKKDGKLGWQQQRFMRILKQAPSIKERDLSFTVKVPAKRYDNKFLGIETNLIKEFCLFNFYNEENKKIELPKNYPLKKTNGVTKNYNLQEYEDLMYLIYNELKTGIEDITLLLSSEKKIFDKNKDLINILEKKYKHKEAITDFYIVFNNNPKNKKLEEDIELWKNFIAKIKPEENNKEIIENYLNLYRNFALHYQLQDKVYKKEIVNFLRRFNQINNPGNDDFADKED